jgi:hypothetical protein
MIGAQAVPISKFWSASDDGVAEAGDAVAELLGPFERDQVAAPGDDAELGPSISAMTWLCIRTLVVARSYFAAHQATPTRSLRGSARSSRPARAIA